MPLFTPLLLGILLPAAVTALGLLLTRKTAPSSLTLLPPPAGFLAACLAILGPPSIPARERLDWIPLLVLFATTVAMIEARPATRPPLAWAMRLALIILAVGALVRPVIEPSAGLTPRTAAICAAVTATTLLAWGLTARAASQPRQPAPALDLTITAAAAGIAFFLAYNAKLAQLAGALAAVLTAAGALARPRFTLSPPALAVPAAVLASLLMLATAGNALPLPSALLLAAAPAAPLATNLPFLRKAPPSARFATRAALLAAALSAAIAIAIPEPS